MSDTSSKEFQDELRNAEILIQEGMLKDAKKLLWKMLRSGEPSSRVRGLLDEIQKKEYEVLLNSASIQTSSEIENKEIPISLQEAKKEAFDLKDFSIYKNKIHELLLNLSARDKMDFAVSQIEMELYDQAVEVLEDALNDAEYELQALYLLAYTLILSNNPLEATIRLEPLLRSHNVSDENKIDFLYLMGMAFEKLGDKRKAIEYYKRVYFIQPRYRDVAEKVK